MIYSVDINMFPSGDQVTELHSYQDENDFEWQIARIENGFFIGYFGHPYFKESFFDIEANDKSFLIRNTGCFFIQNTDFDIFYEFRNILKNGYTDEIWDAIKEFLTERLSADPGLTEYEIMQP